MRPPNKFEAIVALVGGRIGGKGDGSEVNYGDGQTPPTEAEIDAEIVRLQAEYDANQFQRDRQPDYPNLAEQFDLLWHAIDADTLDKTSDFYTTLKAVKDAHPKG